MRDVIPARKGMEISFCNSKINFKDKLFRILRSFVDGCLAALILAFIRSGILYYFDLMPLLLLNFIKFAR